MENVVRANLLAAAAPRQACGQVYNIACGRRIDLKELVELLNGILGTSIAPRHDPPRPGDILHSLADIGRARESLGYEPRVDVTEGLRRTVEWYRSLAAPESADRPVRRGNEFQFIVMTGDTSWQYPSWT